MAALDDFLTLDDLAAQCGVSRRTVARWISVASPGLPVTKLGRRPLVHRNDLADWLRARRVQRNVRRTR